MNRVAPYEDEKKYIECLGLYLIALIKVYSKKREDRQFLKIEKAIQMSSLIAEPYATAIRPNFFQIEF